MRRMGLTVLLSCFIITAYIFATAFDNESLKIHPFVQSASNCTQCHSKNDRKISDPATPCSELCFTCHYDMKNHHAINVKVSGKTPEELRLTGKKRLSCNTCHRPDSARFDSSSWKAESLYEKAFGGKSQYKTYFLIKKNNDGQLCKTCH
jgi:hypothetical protein